MIDSLVLFVHVRIGQVPEAISSCQGNVLAYEKVQAHTCLGDKVILRSLLIGMQRTINHPHSPLNVRGNP